MSVGKLGQKARGRGISHQKLGQEVFFYPQNVECDVKQNVEQLRTEQLSLGNCSASNC